MNTRTFYCARCHNCQDPGMPVPFDTREDRDAWVSVHRMVCRNAIDTWKEIRRVPLRSDPAARAARSRR